MHISDRSSPPADFSVGRLISRFSRFLLLACCFLLVGCRFPGAVRPTVKIGLVAPFEGRYRYVGYDVIYAVRLALQEVNDAGGLGRYNVELVAYDDGADSAMAMEQARKLAVDPLIVAVIGHFREETTLAAAPAHAEAGMPLVAPAVLAPAHLHDEAPVYYPGSTGEAVAAGLLHRLDELGLDRAALVTQGGPLGAALQQEAYARRIGPVVSPGEADGLEEILASGAEAVLCDADPVTSGEVAVALQAAGWGGVLLGGPELAAADFPAVAGEAAGGTVFVTPWPFPGDAVGGEEFAERYRALSNGASPGTRAFPAYRATRRVLEALGQEIAVHGRPTREGTAAALAEQEWGDCSLYSYRIGDDGEAKLLDFSGCLR